MATKDDVIADLSKVINDNWDDICSEIQASKSKSNNVSILLSVDQQVDNSLKYNLRVSFKKPTTVSQSKTITVNGKAV